MARMTTERKKAISKGCISAETWRTMALNTANRRPDKDIHKAPLRGAGRGIEVFVLPYKSLRRHVAASILAKNSNENEQ